MYASNHVAQPQNVAHQTANVHIQQPQVIHQTIQTNNGQLQQLNPSKYQQYLVKMKLFNFRDYLKINIRLYK